MLGERYDRFAVPADAPEMQEPIASKEAFWFSLPDRSRWMFKPSRPAKGEDWAEVLASEVAELLGLPHADYRLASWRGKQGVITPIFHPAGHTLVPGNELLQELDPEYPRGGPRRQRPKRYTIEAVAAVVGADGLGPPDDWARTHLGMTAGQVFAGYLLLDAWIGNTDRHHQNWGLIVAPEGRRYLAPTFDHASSLGAHEDDAVRAARLASPNPRYRPDAYVTRAAAKSPFYRSPDDARHLTMLEAFRECEPMLSGGVWIDRLSRISEKEVEDLPGAMPHGAASGPARDFAAAILAANRRRILG